MSDTDRRGFLRGGLKAALLGTGGVLLPMEGRSLFSFPNVATLPDIPVIAKGFTPSPETLELRRIVERMWEANVSKLGREGYPYGHRGRYWLEHSEEYARVASAVLDRPVQSWGQVAEIAEIAWARHPKAWIGPGPNETFGMLTLDGYQGYYHPKSICRRAVPSLIEAVMQMGAGVRRDPAYDPTEAILERQLSREELNALAGAGERPA